MTKARLLATLQEIRVDFAHDGEAAHSNADDALLSYIGDEQITAAYRAASPGWCA